MNRISECLSRHPGTSAEIWCLFGAAADGDNALVARLVDEHPEWMHHQVWYEFPIHYAVREGHAKVVKTLLDVGSNPAFLDFNYSSWQSLLPIAKARHYEDVHDVLVQAMTRRFNYRSGYQPFWDAIASGNFDDVKTLVLADPSIIHIGDEHGNRALHWAALSRRIAIIDFLLDQGAEIQAERADGQTPLHVSTIADYWYRKLTRLSRVSPVNQLRIIFCNLVQRLSFVLLSHLVIWKV